MGQQDQLNHAAGNHISVDLQRDLNWLLQSQPLISSTPEVEIFYPRNIAHNLEKTYSYVKNYPAQPAYRLGKHFEDCVEHLFDQSPTNNIMARNLVIQTPERTLGELDLIYQNSDAAMVHLEVAIKFYLLTKGGTELADFIGPAGHDRLDLKWQRLLQHQMPMSQNGEVLDFLQCQNHPLPTQQELLFTGMLFYAYENWRSVVIEGIGLNPQHQRGWWLEHHELEQLNQNPGSQRGYIILPKWHWIGGPRHYPSPQPVAFKDLCLGVTADVWPNMVLVYERAQGDLEWAFKHRGLILATKKPPLVS